MTDHPELIDVPLDANGAPIPGVTPKGWYLDPTSPTGERAWSGKVWGLGKKRPNGIPLGPAPSFSQHMANADAARAAKDAEKAAKFAEDYPELAADATAHAQRIAAAQPAPVQVAVAPAPVPAPAPLPISTEAALNTEVVKLSRQGFTVTDRTPGQVILQRKKPISFLYILVMILLAMTVIGILLIFPLLRMVNGKKETVVLTVDPAGRVRSRKS